MNSKFFIQDEGFSYDDILIVPAPSDIESRLEINLSSSFGDVKLNLPIMSAPMDTVTNSEMAIAIAEKGGLGIIHRFQSIEAQSEEVKRVKRARNVIIREPFHVYVDETLEKVRNLELAYGVHTFPVLDRNGKLQGLLTRSDYIFDRDLTIPVSKRMTEACNIKVLELQSLDDFKLEDAIRIIRSEKIKALPLVDQDRKLLGLVTRKDILRLDDKQSTIDKQGRLCVGAAVGIRGDWLERSEQLAKDGVDIFCIDVANGYLERVGECVRALKRRFPSIPVMAGNVATPDGVIRLSRAGADLVKVGIGPGAVCTTRVVTGVGVPQASAILLCCQNKGNSKIVADGGCKTTGDIAKALALGADFVMLGSMLAGTDESPGELISLQGRRAKSIRGMASAFAFRDKVEHVREQPEFEPASEGVNIGFVEYRGSVREILENIDKALRSSFSYVGARNLSEFHDRSKIIKITASALKESLPHSIKDLA